MPSLFYIQYLILLHCNIGHNYLFYINIFPVCQCLQPLFAFLYLFCVSILLGCLQSLLAFLSLSYQYITPLWTTCSHCRHSCHDTINIHVSPICQLPAVIVSIPDSFSIYYQFVNYLWSLLRHFWYFNTNTLPVGQLPAVTVGISIPNRPTYYQFVEYL